MGELVEEDILDEEEVVLENDEKEVKDEDEEVEVMGWRWNYNFEKNRNLQYTGIILTQHQI